MHTCSFESQLAEQHCELDEQVVPANWQLALTPPLPPVPTVPAVPPLPLPLLPPVPVSELTSLPPSLLVVAPVFPLLPQPLPSASAKAQAPSIPNHSMRIPHLAISVSRGMPTLL